MHFSVFDFFLWKFSHFCREFHQFISLYHLMWHLEIDFFRDFNRKFTNSTVFENHFSKNSSCEFIGKITKTRQNLNVNQKQPTLIGNIPQVNSFCHLVYRFSIEEHRQSTRNTMPQNDRDDIFALSA